MVLRMRAQLFDTIEKEAEWNNVEPQAAIAVMMAESGGNPGAIGDDGFSIGLWQLHEAGAGAHMTDDDRISIVRSTAVAIAWLGELHDLLENWPHAWSAYNQGLQGFRDNGVTFTAEYVSRVQDIYERLCAEDFARVEDLSGWVEWA